MITANCLVWRPAFEAVGGFDERFKLAAGEDVDLGVKLRQLGALSYAPDAIVAHDFGQDAFSFVRRFVRYGRGNRLLAQIHGLSLRPFPFLPAQRTPTNMALALLQYAALSYGYWVGPL